MRSAFPFCVLLLCSCDDVRIEFADEASLEQLGDGHSGTAGQSPQPPDAGAPAPEAECTDFPLGCPTQERPKCTLVPAEEGGFRSACVPQTGDRAVGQRCARSGLGEDDCDLGAFCSGLGIGLEQPPRFRCRTLCSSDTSCLTEERCLAVQGAPELGTCVATCELFGQDCEGAGLRCALGQDTTGLYRGYCERFAERQEGEDCGSTSECAQALHCTLPAAKCRALCRDEDPCPADRRCIPLQLGDPASPRICVP